jgi:2-dehydro-3-deoxygluconokinase
MSRVVCFGELMLRLSPPGFERLLQTPVLAATFGGSEANVAISLARFGTDVTYVTRLPANAIGDAAIGALRREGVDTAHVSRGGPRLGIYFVETGAGQRPSTVTYDRTPSSLSTIQPSDVNWLEVLTGASWLHVSGITPALGEGPARCVADGMAAARAAGVMVSFDLNYRAMLWTMNEAAPVLQQLARTSDVLIASQDHLEPLLGIPQNAVAPRVVAERFGSSLVAITSRECRSASQNAVSAVLWDGGAGELLTGPRYDVEIVDRIGAGDAFTAGLIYSLTNGRRSAAALEFAVAAGALKHTIPGDANLVSVEEVDRLASGDSSGRVRR